MKYAIIESGGKQYKAVEGATIDVDLLDAEIGAEVNLDNVLLLVEDETITIGTPSIKGAAVSTTVVDHVKGPKAGHFQVFTQETHSRKDRTSPAITHV